jgi:PAS domain-containing protein
MFGIDSTGRVIEWNRTASELSEFSREELVGGRFCDIPGFLTLHKILGDALKGEDTNNVLFTFRTKSGIDREWLINSTSCQDSGGTHITGAIGIAREYSRLTAEIQDCSAASELVSSEFIKKANTPIFGVDGSCSVVLWNEKISELTGITAEKIIGRDIFQVLV